MKLPFLQESKWPTAREPEERVANPSHDRQLQDHLIDEVLMAYEHKDHSKLREAITALVHSFRNEESPSDEM